MIRAHIRFETAKEAQEFVSGLNGTGSVDKFILTNDQNDYRVDARSLLGAIYAMTEFNAHMYLVNETNDGAFPSLVDRYRIL